MKAFLTRLLKPLTIIPQVQSGFWIFVLITIVIGQLGILCGLLFTMKTSTLTFRGLLADNLCLGNFYTFSISLIASSFTPFLIEYIDKKEIRFKHMKVTASLFAGVVLLIPMTVLFSQLVNPTQPITSAGTLDWIQLLFYILSIFACIYLFCLSLLHFDYESYADLDHDGLVRLRRDSQLKMQDSQGNVL